MSELYMIVLQGKEELGNDPEAIRLWAELSGVDIDSIKEDTPFDIDTADRLLRSLPEVIERMRERSRRDVETLEERLKKVLESKQEKSGADELLEKLDKELTQMPILPEEKTEEVEETVQPTPTEEPRIEVPTEPLFALADTEEVEEPSGGVEEQEVEVPRETAEPPVERAAVEEVTAGEYTVVREPMDVPVQDLVSLFKVEGNRIVTMKGSWSDRYAFLLPLAASGQVERMFVVLRNGNTVYGESTEGGYIFGEFDERNLGIVKLMFSKVLKAIS